jgi:RNA polymerase sigma-70 factor (sigma-E family)
VETFEEYAAARGPALLRLGYLLAGDRHLAEDVVQAALVDVYRNWAKVTRSTHPDAYVRKVVVNTWLGWRRRASNDERPLAADDVASLGSSTTAARPADTPDFAADVVARDAMWHLLATLPPRSRAVLVLRYYEDADDATISAVLGIGRSAVRSTAARALERLRAGLTGSTPSEALQ